MSILRNRSFFALYFHKFFKHNVIRARGLHTLHNVTTNDLPKENDPSGGKVQASDESTNSLDKNTKSSVVLRKPVSTTFIRDTLIPHIEHSVTFDSHKIPPHLLIQLAISYSKLPHFLIQKEIADRIIDAFIYRITDYGPSDCVQILNTSLQIQGVRNTKIYETIIKRLKTPHIQCELNTLNKLGIARTLSKAIIQLKRITGTIIDGDSTNSCNFSNKDNFKELTTENQNMLAPSPGYYNIEQDVINLSLLKPWTILQKSLQKSKASKIIDLIANYVSDFIIPTIMSELETYDPPELSAILGTIADNAIRDNTKSDFPIIAILMSIILKKYPQTSLLHNIANISSLCKLRIFHPSYLNLLEQNLTDKYKSRNIYHKHLARVIWVFSRYGRLDAILPSLEQQLNENISKFDSRDFARLSQSLPHGSEIISKLANRLYKNIYSITPRDFMFYYIGCIYAQLFHRKELLDGCNKYLHDKNEEFDLVDINRLVSAINKLKRKDLLELFPREWSEIIKNILSNKS
ncbi:conserved Plasmodium protein, unknown function [Babesia microti strain RI]|uniref:Uncharacterized protein n=1 Tax=Babesia microti (strain RI) TaxID=1133968 RepID=A0A1N6LXP2_BABMR|nr:conserved Plasmodium protein, unknown function [Babesia microti strain RI]SIO73646.1 conserved Plasmodium protein, unknown function [Babesia microti strain RI]|eukprot:XP_021337724.1 conserved Plasmodium protein, unknown function [Babesia microti strain RI]